MQENDRKRKVSIVLPGYHAKHRAGLACHTFSIDIRAS